MATDFNNNSIMMFGGLRATSVDTPIDVRTRIETLDDIYDIPMPYIGMMVYVKDTGKRYEVLSLKDKKVGLKVTKNAMVDTYQEISFYDEESEIFETNKATVNDFGGIPANTNLNGMTTHEILAKLLFPYIAPVVNVSCSPNGGMYEKGDIQTVSNVAVSVVKKSEEIAKIEILDGNTIIATQEDESIINGGTFNYPIDVKINSDKKLAIKITDSLGKTVLCATNQFSFVYPYYIGVCNEDAEINEELILGLNKKIEAKGNKTINYTTNNQKMIIAYPVEYGTISKIYDANNFDITSSFKCNTISVTGLDGVAQNYYVYNNDVSTVKDFAIKFSY